MLRTRRRGTPAVEPRAVSSPDPLTRHQAAGGGDKSGRQAGAAQHGDHERSKLLQADLEIKLHQRRGNILTKSEVETEWTRQGRAVRAAMLEVPAAVAIRYPGVEGLEDTCRHLIIDAMKHLAAGYKTRQA